MDRHRLCKGTYSKGFTEASKTEEEKRAYYKKRRRIPNFSSLFVRNENHNPEQGSREAFDSLCEGVKSLGIFEESIPGQTSNSFRKPLTINSSLTNSSLGGLSHSSANDTFDKLVFVGRPRVPQAPQVTACPSSSGSSLDSSDLLFKSLLSSLPTVDSSWVKGRGLKSVPEANECHEKEVDIKHKVAYLHEYVDQLHTTNYKSLPSVKQHQMSPQLFSSDNSLDISEFRHENGRAPEGQESCKIGQINKGIGGRKGVQTRKEKNSNKVDELFSNPVVSCTDAKKNVKELATSFAVPVIKLSQVASQTDCSLLGQFLDAVDNVSPSVDQKRVSRTSQNSIGSQHSGKSSVKSDICTSTPTNANKHKTVLRNGSHWSLHASSSLENVLSPVPRDNSLITVDTSSVFESPMSFKDNSVVSSNKVEVGPSHGSKYESCLSSHNFEINHPLSEPLDLPRELVKDSSVSKKGNPLLGSCCDSSKEITNESIKEVFVPVYDPKGASNNSLSPLQKINDVESISVATLPVKTSRAVEISPVLVNFTRKKKCKKRQVKRLQSSRDTSFVEKSVVITQDRKIFLTPDQSLILLSRTRQHKSKGEQYPLRSGYHQEGCADDIVKGSPVNNQAVILTKFNVKRSAMDEQSLILTRKPRLTHTSRNHSSDSQQSPAMLRRRISERLFKRMCKSTLGNVASSQESSSCISILSSDNEESSVLTSRAGVTNYSRKQLVGIDNPPKVTRRRTSKKSLKKNTVHCDNVTDVKNELQVLPGQTRRSVRLLLKSCKVLSDDEDELEVPPVQKRMSVKQLSKRNIVTPGDVTDDGEKLQVFSVQSRSSAKQYAKGYVTQSNLKNSINGSEEFSMMDIGKFSVRSLKAGLSHTRASATPNSIISESCIIATFKKRRKRKADLSVFYKTSDSQNMSISSVKSFEGFSMREEKENLLPNDEILETKGNLNIRSEVCKQESDDFKELDCKVNESSADEGLESLKSQISVSESDSISNEHYLRRFSSSESTQESVNRDGSLIGKHVKFLQSVQNLNTSHELENGVESSPFSSLIPVKRGKGWIRSLSNMASAQMSFNADGSFDGIRRQTIHRISTGQRKTSYLRMSAIPPEINNRIQQMGVHPIEEVHNRSTLQINFCCDGNKQQDCQLPSDPEECVLQLCSQEKPLPLMDCFTETRLTCCKKIGEGVYGEVFMTKPNPSNLEGATVLKIMPIEGSFPVNGEPQKKFEEILSEIIISTELSNLQKPHRKENWTENFVHVLKSWCVQGRYHEDLLHLWDVFHEEKGSENDRPDIFPDMQLYIVLEFGHGGQDLESYVFNSARNALSVFLQIAYSLAVAEQELEFEHRDLHWGNVLVAQTRVASVEYRLDGSSYNLQTHGLKATVIDFTLSRMKASQCVVYNNLAEDPALFTAEGDYQFEIYRQMKNVNKNDWEKFTPYTNVLWLHYILDKMTSECYFKNVKTKIHKMHHAQLIRMKNEMLSYESATHFVLQREEDIR